MTEGTRRRQRKDCKASRKPLLGQEMRRLAFEQLEERQLLAAVSWVGGTTGYWDTGANWSTGTVPTSSDTVTINPASSATVTIKAGESESASSLTIGAGNTLLMPTGGDPTLPTSNSASNSDFELPATGGSTTVKPTSWVEYGVASAYLSTQYAYTNSQSLVMSVPTSSTGTQTITAFQNFPATVGTSYTASIYAMTPASSPLTGNTIAQLQLLFLNSSGGVINSYTPPNDVTELTSASGRAGRWRGVWVTRDGITSGPLRSPRPTRTKGDYWCRRSTSTVAQPTAGRSTGTTSPSDRPPPSASSLAAGSVSNSGNITVGPPNKITISGGFTQTSTGTLDIQLGGARHEYVRLDCGRRRRYAGWHAQSGRPFRLLPLGQRCLQAHHVRQPVRHVLQLFAS